MQRKPGPRGQVQPPAAGRHSRRTGCFCLIHLRFWWVSPAGSCSRDCEVTKNKELVDLSPWKHSALEPRQESSALLQETKACQELLCLLLCNEDGMKSVRSTVGSASDLESKVWRSGRASEVPTEPGVLEFRAWFSHAELSQESCWMPGWALTVFVLWLPLSAFSGEKSTSRGNWERKKRIYFSMSLYRAVWEAKFWIA